MAIRIGFLTLGFFMSLIGSIYIITYLNLMTVGYNFLEYVNFIIRRTECIIFMIGMILMLLSIILSLVISYPLGLIIF